MLVKDISISICSAGAILVLFFFSQTAFADNSVSKLKKKKSRISSLEKSCIKSGLVDVHTLDPTILIDLKYAKTDNFMGVNVYNGLNRAYLLPEAAEKLAKANGILKENHPDLCLLVADAFRPRSVQQKMWEIVAGTDQQAYVANPFTGSMHNYGAAVDVTLYNEKKGKRLDMGTKVDFFGLLAQPRLESRYLEIGKLSEKQIKNRQILRNTMLEAEWHPINIEWWHFNAFPRKMIRKNYNILE